MKKNDLLDQFKEIVEQFPSNLAVSDDQRAISYSELNQNSNQIAYRLRACGACKGSRVGVLGKRSSWFIEGFMGILKLGAVYVPLDPNYPLDRLKYMISLSKIEFILAYDDAEPIINALKNHGISVKALLLNFNAGQTVHSDVFVHPPFFDKPCEDLSVKVEDDDTAVILFTSGSTGEPKGVELAYSGYINNFSNIQSIFKFNSNTRIAHIASPCFDISLTELWMPLLFGSKIYIATDEVKKNPWLLMEWIQTNEIDTIQFVPSLFQHFVLVHEDAPCRLTSISHLLLLGEALRSSLVKKWFELFAGDGCLVYNLYGPVEASIETTCYTMTPVTQIPGDSVPMGKPFSGVNFYIFDANNSELITEFDKEGKLFIGGAQLAKGYLNSAQTDKAFKHHPTFGRIYDTGDIVKQLPSGDFLYLGRNDRQVKIRGFRIEMGEIEEALMNCKGIKHSAVIADKSNEDAPVLIGFVTGAPSSIERIKEELSAKLPNFMVPHRIMVVNAIPLNSNGKTDQGNCKKIFEAY